MKPKTRPTSFEGTYPHFEFAPLVKLSLVIAVWLKVVVIGIWLKTLLAELGASLSDWRRRRQKTEPPRKGAIQH